MRVRWTTDAADDLERTCDTSPKPVPTPPTVNDDNRRRHRVTLHLSESRRSGRVEGTREFVFAPLPFVAVYEVHEDVQILRILHGAQEWPPA